MFGSSTAARTARAEQMLAALLEWQAGRISCVECARRCDCTFSEWSRVWPFVGRTTPKAHVARRVYRVLRAGKWGGE